MSTGPEAASLAHILLQLNRTKDGRKENNKQNVKQNMTEGTAMTATLFREMVATVFFLRKRTSPPVLDFLCRLTHIVRFAGNKNSPTFS
jgi:hypothetical protein